VSYEVRLDPPAKAQLDRLPEPLRSFTDAALGQLGRAPVSARKSSGRVSRGQIAEFRFNPDPDTALWVSITFLYGADEQTLHVTHIKAEFGE
jgi:hypothetical protein